MRTGTLWDAFDDPEVAAVYAFRSGITNIIRLMAQSEGVTIEEFGERIGLSAERSRDLFKGKEFPTDELLRLMAKLGWRLDAALEGNNLIVDWVPMEEGDGPKVYGDE